MVSLLQLTLGLDKNLSLLEMLVIVDVRKTFCHFHECFDFFYLFWFEPRFRVTRVHSNLWCKSAVCPVQMFSTNGLFALLHTCRRRPPKKTSGITKIVKETTFSDDVTEMHVVKDTHYTLKAPAPETKVNHLIQAISHPQRLWIRIYIIL